MHTYILVVLIKCLAFVVSFSANSESEFDSLYSSPLLSSPSMTSPILPSPSPHTPVIVTENMNAHRVDNYDTDNIYLSLCAFIYYTMEEVITSMQSIFNQLMSEKEIVHYLLQYYDR